LCGINCRAEAGVSGCQYVDGACKEIMVESTTTTTKATTTTVATTTTIPECVLSLCDCKCHINGTTIEQTTGRLCGINCLGEFNVSGCEYKEGSCKEIYVTTTTQPIGMANPASVKCIEDGGELKIVNAIGGENGLCLFPDGSVCDEWAYFRGECIKGDCMRECGAIGSRSEGWYCNGTLLYWDNCANVSEFTLNCSAFAGHEVPGVCTMEYNPVCALVQTANGKVARTYASPCMACKSDDNIIGYKMGECIKITNF
jgi:putative hemolysin